MVKVGFILNFPLEYQGGINYFKNLFFAVNRYYSDDIQIVLFVPSSSPEEVISIFSPYAQIIKTDIIKRKSLLWLVSKISNRFFKFDYFFNRLFKKHEIDVLYYTFSYIYSEKAIKSITWIPDFQSLHYPYFWTEKQLKNERISLDICAEQSDLIVMSSENTANDFNSIYPKYSSKARVLHFVSQPDILKMSDIFDVAKYANRPFYYLPNQFWEHKNHLIVFKALKIAVEKGVNLLVLCSGLMVDFRNNNGYVTSLVNFVKENHLENHIKFLGIIPYEDVCGLIRNSVAVINPSYFEGWSSSVEESKSFNKIILLSDIPVHREQNPDKGFYFIPDDEIGLAKLMEITLKAPKEKLDEEILRESLDFRTKTFASKFKNIIEELVG